MVVDSSLLTAAAARKPACQLHGMAPATEVTLAKRGKTVDLGDDRIEEFMRRLATDDDLRDAMKRDPGATLVGAGVSVPKEGLPKKVTLPSKAALQARLKDYRAKKKLGLQDHIPFHFMHVVRETCATDEEEKKRPKKPGPPKKPAAPKGR